ncbi:ribonuclease P protein component [Candidatus Falkowbacteria bacterium CG10_big_fil_rev_8_21_14_0_10_43_10]|uniref:Ribonuclease P protein component n=1 Tax=Candidatus Falkowbacteria bacterium CG10_big_fil_rev_8_21_14_0_10_43_10 TaxID=1974567 RepID=A0A2H0V4P1_9BACT|nr:MAG: ribonuclease P protein component [Candidatus Falkowbacteria bacterium CG10_big_fil_rev_8_21_14_0_10_43_10]
MLKKENRLTKEKEIENVFKKGKSSFDKTIGVKALPTKRSVSRFCIVISSKVSKKAVIRNKKKRQLREIIRLNLSKLEPGFDFFILGLPRIAGADYHEMEKSLSQHFKRLEVTKSFK